ncbi:zinc-binding dehydrogenase, partial [Actinotalea sp. C106]|uniref:zinc-binding dehydrogenase n=1 Tax=Actinotalea sp. C106 TaxID=2908644 RepID=UPI0020290818
VHRREAAERFGAHAALDPEVPGMRERLDHATAGRGADLVVEVAGNDAAVAAAVEVARPGATVVLAGIPDQDTTTFPASVARRKGLTLRLSRRMKEMYPRSIALVETGAVDVRSIVTTVAGLDEVSAAFQTARLRSGLKVVVDPGR